MRVTTSTALAVLLGLGLSGLPAEAQQTQPATQPQTGQEQVVQPAPGQQVQTRQPAAAPQQQAGLQEIERRLEEARQALQQQDYLRAEQLLQDAQQTLYQVQHGTVAAAPTEPAQPTEQAAAQREPAVVAGQPTQQAEPTVARPADPATADPASPLFNMRADELIGRNIVNDLGETIGSVDDLVINVQDESVYALVQVGGFLGLGAREVALPLDRMQLTPDDELLLPGMTREQLEQMSEYEAGTHPMLERDRPIMERRARATAG